MRYLSQATVIVCQGASRASGAAVPGHRSRSRYMTASDYRYLRPHVASATIPIILALPLAWQLHTTLSGAGKHSAEVLPSLFYQSLRIDLLVISFYSAFETFL